jgi:hypothetical protein
VHRSQADRVAHQSDRSRPDRLAHLGVHGRERLAYDLQPFRSRYAAAGDEGHVEAAPLHLRRDLRAGAVDDADLVRVGHEVENVRDDAAADLEDDPTHVRYSALMRT